MILQPWHDPLCLNSFRLLRAFSFCLPSLSPFLSLLQNAGWWLMCSMCSPFRSLSLTFFLLPSPHSLVVIEADLSQGHCTSGHGFTHRDSIQPTHSQLRWQIKDMHPQTHTHFDVLPRLMNGGNGASVLHGCVVRALPRWVSWVCTGERSAWMRTVRGHMRCLPSQICLASAGVNTSALVLPFSCCSHLSNVYWWFPTEPHASDSSHTVDVSQNHKWLL